MNSLDGGAGTSEDNIVDDFEKARRARQKRMN
jgi:hypothetical protein